MWVFYYLCVCVCVSAVLVVISRPRDRNKTMPSASDSFMKTLQNWYNSTWTFFFSVINVRSNITFFHICLYCASILALLNIRFRSALLKPAESSWTLVGRLYAYQWVWVLKFLFVFDCLPLAAIIFGLQWII